MGLVKYLHWQSHQSLEFLQSRCRSLSTGQFLQKTFIGKVLDYKFTSLLDTKRFLWFLIVCANKVYIGKCFIGPHFVKNALNPNHGNHFYYFSLHWSFSHLTSTNLLNNTSRCLMQVGGKLGTMSQDLWQGCIWLQALSPCRQESTFMLLQLQSLWRYLHLMRSHCTIKQHVKDPVRFRN